MLTYENLINECQDMEIQNIGITHRFKSAVLGIESSNFVQESAIGINGLLR
jgi:hypothetical protein